MGNQSEDLHGNDATNFAGMRMRFPDQDAVANPKFHGAGCKTRPACIAAKAIAFGALAATRPLASVLKKYRRSIQERTLGETDQLVTWYFGDSF